MKICSLLIICLAVLMPAYSAAGLSFGASWSIAVPGATGTADRSVWQVCGGLHFDLTETAVLHLAYTYGGIIFGPSGYTSFHGPRLTARSSIADRLSAGLGGELRWIRGYRTQPTASARILAGVPLEIGDALHASQEVWVAYAFGEAAEWAVGTESGFSASVP